MPRNDRGGSSTPKKKHDLDPYATNDPDCVAEFGWEHEPSPWRMSTCRDYVKMKHLLKLVPVRLRSEAVEKQAKRGEIRAENCESDHFNIRYHEIFEAANIQNSRPLIMLYSNMAMVWAEIVLHKRVDWRTTLGLKTNSMNREHMDIDTTWIGGSDCPPLHISNRRSPPAQDAGIQTLAIEYNVEEQQRRPSSDDNDGTYRGRRSNENPRNRGGYRGRDLSRTNYQEYGQYSAHRGHRSRERHDVGRHEQGYGYGEPERAPVAFGEHSGVYGPYGGPPWPDYATESRSYTDGWSEIPSPPRSASPRHRTPVREVRHGYSPDREEVTQRLGRDDYATPPPYRGYGGHATPFALFADNDYRSSSPPRIFPPPLGYHDDATQLNSGENRDVLHPNDRVPGPPFGYPPGRVVRDCYLEEESELERTRQDYVRRMENSTFHLRRDNRRLMEERDRLLRASTNFTGHGPQETYDQGGPSELPNDGNWVHPYDYDGLGWRGDY